MVVGVGLVVLLLCCVTCMVWWHLMDSFGRLGKVLEYVSGHGGTNLGTSMKRAWFVHKHAPHVRAVV